MAGKNHAKFPVQSETIKRFQSKQTRHDTEEFNKSPTHTLYAETWHTAVTPKWLWMILGTALVWCTVNPQWVLTWIDPPLPKFHNRVNISGTRAGEKERLSDSLRAGGGEEVGCQAVYGQVNLQTGQTKVPGEPDEVKIAPSASKR